MPRTKARPEANPEPQTPAKLRERIEWDMHGLKERLEQYSAAVGEKEKALKEAIDKYGAESAVREGWESCLKARAVGRLALMVGPAIKQAEETTTAVGLARAFIGGLRAVIEEAHQEALRAAKYPTRSTCPLTNFADSVKGAAVADWYEEWERHLRYFEEKVVELERLEPAANA